MSWSRGKASVETWNSHGENWRPVSGMVQAMCDKCRLWIMNHESNYLNLSSYFYDSDSDWYWYVTLILKLAIGCWYLCNTIMNAHAHAAKDWGIRYNWQDILQLAMLAGTVSVHIKPRFCLSTARNLDINHQYHRHRHRIQLGGMCDVITSSTYQLINLSLITYHLSLIIRLRLSLSHQNSEFSLDQDCQTTPYNSCLAKGTHIFSDCAGGHRGGHCVVHEKTCNPDKLENGEVVDSEDCKSFESFSAVSVLQYHYHSMGPWLNMICFYLMNDLL